MLKNYFKIAWRNLLKHSTLSLINITGLTMGVAACILITLYVIHETSYDKHIPDGHNIYRVLMSFKDEGEFQRSWSMAAPMASTVKDIFEEVEESGRIMANNLFFGAGSNEIKVGEDFDQFHETGFAYADQSTIDMFRIPMKYGDAETALKEPNTIIISENKAEKFFENENPVGKSIILNGDNANPRKITAVMKDFPSSSHMSYDYFLSLSGVELDPGEYTRWTQTNYYVYIKLKPNTNVGLFEKKFSDVMINNYLKPELMTLNRDLAQNITDRAHFSLQPLHQIHLYSSDINDYTIRGDIKIIYLFGAIAFFILIIACINYINLTTAKSANRAPEIGLRKVVGSQRKNLILQFLTESILITTIVFVAGLILVQLLLPYFNHLADRSLTIPWQEPWFLPSLFTGVLFVGLLAGIYPALFLSGFLPIQVLKGGFRHGIRSKGFRTVLVVFQFAISTILIVSTFVIYQQMNFILNKKVGYEKDQVIQIYGTNMVGRQIETFKDELKNVNGVVNVTVSDYLPIDGTKRNGNAFWNQGKQAIDEPVFGQSWIIDEDYISTLGLNLIAGRNFSRKMATDRQAAIINQTMARELGLVDPVGKILVRNQQEYNIIGLVEDFNFQNLTQKVDPISLRFGNSQSIVSVKVQPTEINSVINDMEKVWNEFVPNSVFRYTFMDESYANMYDNVYRTRSIFTSFAILAIFIACLGLFALSAFLMDQRKKELSIRKTLGASIQSIFQLVTQHFIGLVLISIFIAGPLAYFIMQRWLQDFAYRIEITWKVFLWAGILSILIALFTISYHAIKSALVNPAINLRTE